MRKLRRIIAMIFVLMLTPILYAAVPLSVSDLLSVKNNPYKTTAGNPKGDVTLIEFTDFNCGYCKMMVPVVKDLMQKDKKLRVVFIEYPVIEASSALGAQGAMAALKQGKYLAFHNALMNNQTAVDYKSIMKVAADLNLDINKFAKDLNSPEVKQQANDNINLGSVMGVPGTPTFIIGKTIFDKTTGNEPQPVTNFGYMPIEDLQDGISSIRKGSNG